MTALQFIRATPRLPDARYWLLHLKCADGSITEDEAAELDLMQAEKVAEYEQSMGDYADEPRTVATQAPPRAGSRLGHSVGVNYRKENDRG